MDLLNLGIFGAAAALVGSLWSYLKSSWGMLRGLIVIEVIFDWLSIDAVLLYLNENYHRMRTGDRQYFGDRMRLTNAANPLLVIWETIASVGVFYRRGWRLLWVHPMAGSNDSRQPKVGVASGIRPDKLRISFIRGMFDPDEIVRMAAAYFNSAIQNPRRGRTRFYVQRVVGVSLKRAMSRDQAGNAPEVSPPDLSGYMGVKPVSHHLDDLKSSQGTQVSDLALDKAAAAAVEEVRHWKFMRSWYEVRGIPWQRGWLIYGEVGMGKTALARAIARDLDLPLYVYDLASLSNDELVYHWSNMLASAPCVALFEDIDAIFNGRKTIQGELTFDCLLNCLDGVEYTGGLFTIITTNKVDVIDPAIADVDGDMSSRPGRVDRVLYMGPPNRAGRHKIAGRILKGMSDADISYVVRKGIGLSGAQFQELCFRRALEETSLRELSH